MPRTTKQRTTPTSPRRVGNHPRSWWHEHYQAWRASGLSKSAYCVQQRLNVSSFSNWTRRFNREACEAPQARNPVFFKALPEPSATPHSGQVRTLSFQALSLTFDEPIRPEALSVWIQAIKAC